MHKILLWGNEGCGKSTIAALLARYAVAGGWSVLVVDAGGGREMHRFLGLPRPKMTLVEDMGGAEYVHRLYPRRGPDDLFPDLPVDNLPASCLSRRDNLALLSLGAESLEEVGVYPLAQLFREFMGRLDDSGWWVLVDAGGWLAEAGREPLQPIDGILAVDTPDVRRECLSAAGARGALAAPGLPRFPVLNRAVSWGIADNVEQGVRPLAVFPEEKTPIALSPESRGLPFPPDFLVPLRGLWGTLMSDLGSPRASRIGFGGGSALRA